MKIEDIQTTFDFLYYIADAIGSKEYINFGKTVDGKEVSLQDVLKTTAEEFATVMKALEGMAASYLLTKVKDAESLDLDQLNQLLNSEEFSKIIQEEISEHVKEE